MVDERLPRVHRRAVDLFVADLENVVGVAGDGNHVLVAGGERAGGGLHVILGKAVFVNNLRGKQTFGVLPLFEAFSPSRKRAHVPGLGFFFRVDRKEHVD